MYAIFIVVASAVLELDIGPLEKASDGTRRGFGDSAANLRCPEQSSSRQNETSRYCHIGRFGEDRIVESESVIERSWCRGFGGGNKLWKNNDAMREQGEVSYKLQNGEAAEINSASSTLEEKYI